MGDGKVTGHSKGSCLPLLDSASIPALSFRRLRNRQRCGTGVGDLAPFFVPFKAPRVVDQHGGWGSFLHPASIFVSLTTSRVSPGKGHDSVLSWLAVRDIVTYCTEDQGEKSVPDKGRLKLQDIYVRY
jgi:hypothetical protein